MDAVYAAGSLPIAADDRATKVMATRLTIFGFVVIDEMQADGTPRRLRPSEAFHASHRSPLARLEALRPLPGRRQPACVGPGSVRGPAGLKALAFGLAFPDV